METESLFSLSIVFFSKTGNYVLRYRSSKVVSRVSDLIKY